MKNRNTSAAKLQPSKQMLEFAAKMKANAKELIKKFLDKTTVMNLNDFNSKQHFKDSLRIAYDLGTFFHGMKVSSSIVLSYYTYLKEGYKQNEIACKYFEPESESNVGMISFDIKCWEVIEPIHLWAPVRDTRKSSHVFEQRQSNKEIQESLSRTTVVGMIGDSTIRKMFTAFLLQVQGGSLAGSSKEGMSAPKAAVLMTSNSEELPRLIGKVVQFNYSGPVSDHPAYNKDLLHNNLPFIEENK
ncbi:Hypothetical predicted protein, partial [Paramuricea clavata]